MEVPLPVCGRERGVTAPDIGAISTSPGFSAAADASVLLLPLLGAMYDRRPISVRAQPNGGLRSSFVWIRKPSDFVEYEV